MLANVNSEPYTMIMGLHMNNVAWNLFVDSGIIFAPFIVMFLRNYIKAKTGGQDEGPVGSILLNYIEADLYKMILVLIFCVIPVSTSGGTSNTSYISYSCSTTPLVTGGGLEDASVIGGITEENPKVQMWWWITHEVSTYITNYMVANVPCANDSRFASIAFNAKKITDPQDQNFAREFYKQCYSPAINEIVRKASSVDEENDLWPGSEKAKSQYGKETSVMTIEKSYWVSKTGDSSSLDPARGPEAYPSCSAAFNHLNNIVAIEIEKIKDETWYSWFLPRNSTMEKEMMKKIMGASQTIERGFWDSRGDNAVLGASDQRYNKGSAGVTDAALAVGSDLKSIPASVDALGYRLMSPHLVGAVQMVILASVPILLIVGGLNISTAGVLTGWYFAAEFTLLIQELAYWFDNMMTNVLSHNTGVFGPGSSGESAVMKLLANFSYQWFPLIWLTIASAFGVKGLTAAVTPAGNVSSGSVGAIGNVAGSAAGAAGGPVGKVVGGVGKKMMSR